MLVGASYCMDICWERKRRKFLMKLNKIDKATGFIFSPCFLFIQFKRILYLKIRIFFFCRYCGVSPRNTNAMHVCAHVYVCTNVDKVLDFKVHEVKNWHKYPHVLHLGLWVTTIYCLNYFADGLR